MPPGRFDPRGVSDPLTLSNRQPLSRRRDQSPSRGLIVASTAMILSLISRTAFTEISSVLVSPFL